MNHLLVIAMLLTLLPPQEQNLPDAYYQLPEQVRERATLIVTGTYGQGRSPCILRPDGTRFWALESMIRITKVYRGKVGGKFIYLNAGAKLDGEPISRKLNQGQKYLVLLRPNEESMKAIQAGEYVRAWDALGDEEIIATVELK